MTEDLAYIYYALQEMTNQAKARAESDKKQSKKLLAFADITGRLAASLVSLSGDFYVDEGEEIGESISQLYRYISSYPGKPSNSQINQAELLDDKLDIVKEKFEVLVSVNLQKINDRLLKNELQPISYLAKEDFLKE
jgi:hypothetical protein